MINTIKNTCKKSYYEFDNLISHSHNIIASCYFTDIKFSKKPVLITYRQSVVIILSFLKLYSNFSYVYPIDILVADYPLENYRFTVKYFLRSHLNNSVVSIATKTNEILNLPSTQHLYPAFNWSEREVWDLFGISFSKHPDLRRILTDYGFIGHPLQKNYPLGGLVQLGFSEIQKATVAEAIKILPGFRYNIVKSQPNPLL